MKSRTGYVYKNKKTSSWFARVTYSDSSERRKNIQRKVENSTEGNKLLKELIRKFDTNGPQSLEAEKITFNDLCDYYSTHYLKVPVYVNGRKIDGLRSVTSVKGYLKVFREYFGSQKLISITYEDLRTFRSIRLETPTHQSAQRSIATVNRELA